MLSRSLPDPVAPAEADIDTDATTAAAAAVERDEWHLQALGEVAQIGLTLARSLGELAAARIEAAKRDDCALAPDDDAILTAFNKIAQTLRRTIALREKLDAQALARRGGLSAERARRRADLEAGHAAAKSKAIIYGFHDAYAADCPPDEYAEQVERLMADVREHLLDADADEMRGWLERPVGETVAKLCAALGLDPGACAFNGQTWTVRRPPTEFERTLADRACTYGKPPSSPSSAGTDANGDASRETPGMGAASAQTVGAGRPP